jgi:hypothetical protein
MTPQNISIKEAAEMLGKSQQFVRIALQQDKLPIGVAVKTSTQYSYHISPKLLKEYIGGQGGNQ